jgi:hypothetical protein
MLEANVRAAGLEEAAASASHLTTSAAAAISRRGTKFSKTDSKDSNKVFSEAVVAPGSSEALQKTLQSESSAPVGLLQDFDVAHFWRAPLNE